MSAPKLMTPIAKETEFLHDMVEKISVALEPKFKAGRAHTTEEINKLREELKPTLEKIAEKLGL